MDNLIGDRIKILRLESNLTQRELALKLGLKGKSSIANYENSSNAPSDEVKLKMCKLFNCSLDYLMGLTSVKKKVYNEKTMLSKEEIEKFIQEMTEVRPEKLNEEALKLYSKIMEILDKNEQLEADKQKLIKKLEKDMQDNIETVKYYENAIQNNPNATDRKSWLRSKTIALTKWETEKEILKILKGESNE